MRLRGLLFCAACLVAGANVACETYPICPSDWVLGNTPGSPTCDPPEGYAEAVAQRLGTGFFGYALVCVDDPSREEHGPCNMEGLAAGKVFEMRVRDPAQSSDGGEPHGEPSLDEYFWVSVQRDGTFEFQATPGATYVFAPELNTIGSSEPFGPIVEEVMLVEGQVAFVRVTVYD